jgi:hypothetical protein
VVEEPPGVLAVVPSSLHQLGGLALHAVLDVTASAVDSGQRRLQHPVLVGVVGLGGGGAHVEARVAR